MVYEDLVIAILEQGFKDLAVVDKTIKQKMRNPRFPCKCVDVTCKSIRDLEIVRMTIIYELTNGICQNVVSFDIGAIIEMYEKEILKYDNKRVFTANREI